MIYLLLGSNLGDKRANLDLAIQQIEAELGVISKMSSVYQTAAWGLPSQPDFYNQTIGLETELAPIELLQKILMIEQNMGRVRIEKWGERLIDIDLLLYHDNIIDLPELKIPHPEMTNRKFTMVPLAEIAGDIIHPLLQKTIHRLLDECKDPLIVTIVPDRV